MLSNSTIPTCPDCKGYNTGALHWQAASIWQCKKCQILYKKPFPMEEKLMNLYETSWSDPCQNTRETGRTDLKIARQYARYIARSVGRQNFHKMRLLDFGAGRGALLKALHEFGAECYGVEPFGFNYLKRKGYSVFRSLEEIPPELQFDGIVTMDVIEHLPNPWEMFEKLGTRLSSGGWIIVATPNAHGLAAEIKRERWGEASKPGHIILFTPKTLCEFLLRSGFVSPQRLTWFVRYSESPIQTAIHFSLQAFRLEGQLRYLAIKK